jgi:hypothetical protein
MYKYFLKPLWTVIGVYFVAALSIVANIYQLTNYNLLDFLKTHSPQSYYFVIAGTLFLYFLLVIIQFISHKPIQQASNPDSNYGQIISTRDITNSTIIQNRKDKDG